MYGVGMPKRWMKVIARSVTTDALAITDESGRRAALKEAHTGYPVPRYMTLSQCEDLIHSLLPPAEPASAPPKRAVKKTATRRKPAAA